MKHTVQFVGENAHHLTHMKKPPTGGRRLYLASSVSQIGRSVMQDRVRATDRVPSQIVLQSGVPS